MSNLSRNAFRLPVRRSGIVVGGSKPHQAMANLDGLMSFINKDDSNKSDMLVKVSAIEFTERKTLAIPTAEGTKEYTFNQWSFDQLAKLCKIPGGYLTECPVTGRGGMKDQIEMRMEKRAGEELMVRVRNQPQDGDVKTSGVVRAILPSEYAAFDNRHMIAAMRRAMKEAGGEERFTMEMTTATDPRRLEEELHLRFTSNDQFELDVPEINDPHKIGFHCRTSEIGHCDVRLDALVWRLVCKNGMMGWADGEVVRIKHKNLVMAEIGPQLHEGVLAAIRQEEPVRALLSASYNEPIRDADTFIAAMARRVKVGDGVVERVTAIYRAAQLPMTRFGVMQAFTQAAGEMPLDERSKIEESVGKAFFGGMQRSQIVEASPAE